jgi:ABC-type transport system, involved in lipoprotein release, permease component
MISVCGVVVATIAMVCTLSVFNGFKGFTSTFFSAFDPDLKITPVEGKVFDPTTAEMKRVCELPEILLRCDVLQENALVSYGNRQEISVLKGVDSSFLNLVQIEKAIIDGEFILSEGEFNYGVLGVGLASTLGVNSAFVRPLRLYMPIRDQQINASFPASSFQEEFAYIGGVYNIFQPVYDNGFMFVPLRLMRSMLNYEKEVSALELRLDPGADVSSVKKQIIDIIGDGFYVKDRYEQQETSFKIIQIEKWLSFLMCCFILVLALFNVLGSLAILMIEKEEDVKKLRSMGADNRLINRIFLFEGWMISLLGGIIGVVIGIFLCFLQQRFGFIKLGETAGTFVVDAYPVVVEWADVLIVFVTVVTIGFIAVLYPVHFLGKKWLNRGVALCLALPLLISCGGQKKDSKNENSNNDQTKEIAVTIEPLRFFAEKISGDDYKFFSIVPVGQSPETYDPSPREMMRVGQGLAYLHLGQLSIEQIIAKTIEENNLGTRVFDISTGMDIHLEGAVYLDKHDESKTHQHGHSAHDGHDHSAHSAHNHGAHAGHDPHIWTSFAGAKVMTGNILKALISLDNEKESSYKDNYSRLNEELELLEKDLHDQLDTLTCRGFVIFHPALTYFAEEFGLTQLSIEEDGKEPSPSSLKELIEEARSKHVKVVFVQMEFDRRHAEQIALEIGAKIVTINPLDYKWDEQMRKIAKALVTNGEAY